MNDIVSYVGLNSGKNMGGGTYTTHLEMSPAGEISGANPLNTYVTDTNASIDLLNQRKGDINQPTLPDIYKQLKSKEAKKEFRTFWQLVQSIASNYNAHEYCEKKQLITTEPLLLNNFFQELHESKISFDVEDFLKPYGITLGRANLTRAKLNKANFFNGDSATELYNAVLAYADLSEANLRLATLGRADLTQAILTNADLSEADLSEAWLNYADLREADLSEAWLTEANLRQILISPKTKFSKGTLLDNIRCNSIRFVNEKGEETEIDDQDKIRKKFIELGASKEKISFAQAA